MPKAVLFFKKQFLGPFLSKISKRECKMLKCLECNEAFQMSEGEKNFYIQRDLSFPKRCIACRDKRKVQIQPELSKNGSENPALSQIQCDNCGKETKVPFKPEPNRKAYCKVCWNGVRNVGVTAEFI
tara:strand:+ start:596 stop:976 length:381 start_codon:yes stop_codon:yes gene_type:complete